MYSFFFFKQKTADVVRISDWSSDVCSSDLIADRIATIPAHRPQDHITLEMAPLEIRHRSVRPISAKHAQASRFLQQSRRTDRRSPYRSPAACYSVASRPNQRSTI